ncbi:hypothetical protein LUZ60_014607 [Juncus effusus]|nr:hypothetical protein LUZ60_014607 [Juncus effusus]
MATDEPKLAIKKTTKNKKKKVKRDKWGQPLPPQTTTSSSFEEEEEYDQQPEADVAAEPPAKEAEHEANKVVASGMPYTATEEEIREMFEEIGPIETLQLSRFPDSGNFRGLAFITFQSEEAVINSLELDGTKMGNRFVKVERCRMDPQKRKRKTEFSTDPQKADGCLSAYVGNLSWDINEDDIRAFLKDSNISSVRFAVDKNTGKSRGFCHVDFEDDESLENAVRKNQMDLNGRPVKIAYAIINRN